MPQAAHNDATRLRALEPQAEARPCRGYAAGRAAALESDVIVAVANALFFNQRDAKTRDFS